MTLPQDILKRIDSDANDYLGMKEVEFSQRSFNAYVAGATEWVGKAQEKEAWYIKRIKSLRDTLEQILHAPVPANELEYMAWFVAAKNVAGGTISNDDAEVEVAKYKEVENA